MYAPSGKAPSSTINEADHFMTRIHDAQCNTRSRKPNMKVVVIAKALAIATSLQVLI